MRWVIWLWWSVGMATFFLFFFSFSSPLQNPTFQTSGRGRRIAEAQRSAVLRGLSSYFAELVGHSSSVFHSWAAELFGREKLAWKAKLAIGVVLFRADPSLRHSESVIHSTTYFMCLDSLCTTLKIRVKFNFLVGWNIRRSNISFLQ